ncbi:hypothetical protein GS518_15330 [Leptospira interrogans]|uniref:SLEI domain protein, PF07620 family n=2 Tax=Leptospira interrogans TaxID=173 RepID=A0AAQ1NYU1_LEPIR|nr:hypothetical protein LIC_13048 [Leptospira interrogans serovar Copenhageni str. Fiocruz L1-130]AKP24870.1 hypothetical protein LIMLP_02190 [Leptospira interrogans serovar Manilae]ARB95707.1 hypothetical protein A6J42_09440 [Leptospira interrogans serovar Copenhageni]ASP42880.1 hypothetical protein AMR47_19445 [Leptospira interrogans]EKN89048.1 hypothetical protein LEP1GSC027_4135 [Leptospira interrogans str. 2002000624]EKQ45302.1 hypothetical protein LEP1GSC026_0139 [Leptospira interrogans 
MNSAKKFGQIWLCLTALSVPINKLYERNVMQCFAFRFNSELIPKPQRILRDNTLEIFNKM